MESESCYCVCHSPFSSCSWCAHCKGDNDVGRHWQQKLEGCLASLRQAILEGTDDGYGITIPSMLLNHGDKASVWHNEEWEQRMLCLPWPLAQQLFTLLKLTPEGFEPGHDKR